MGKSRQTVWRKVIPRTRIIEACSNIESRLVPQKPHRQPSSPQLTTVAVPKLHIFVWTRQVDSSLCTAGLGISGYLYLSCWLTGWLTGWLSSGGIITISLSTILVVREFSPWELLANPPSLSSFTGCLAFFMAVLTHILWAHIVVTTVLQSWMTNVVCRRKLFSTTWHTDKNKVLFHKAKHHCRPCCVQRYVWRVCRETWLRDISDSFDVSPHQKAYQTITHNCGSPITGHLTLSQIPIHLFRIYSSNCCCLHSQAIGHRLGYF